MDLENGVVSEENLKQVDLCSYLMGQTQVCTINAAHFTSKEGVFLENKGVESIVGLFPTDVPSQEVLHVSPLAASHHIRIFNVPRQNSLVIHLLGDRLLSPTLSTKMFEESSLATFFLIVKDGNGNGNGLSYINSFQLLFKGVGKIIKFLMGVGKSYSNGSMKLTNIEIIVESPLVHEWDPGGPRRVGWDLSGIKRDWKLQQCVTTSAMECHENQTQQYNQAAQFNNVERWPRIVSGIEIKKLLLMLVNF